MTNKNLMLLFSVILSISACAPANWRADAVRNRLADSSELSTHAITIDEQQQGVIRLSGTVSSSIDREDIEQIARNTNGVREVHNNLLVAPSSVIVRDNRDNHGTNRYSLNEEQRILAEIRNLIASSRELRNVAINVVLAGQTAVLTGIVNNNSQRDTAGRIAQNTRGITRVSNEITLADYQATRYQYRVSDTQINAAVRDAISADRNMDLRNVYINTRDGIVTLSGSQNSQQKINQLVIHALAVDGVRDVRSEMTVLNDRYSDRGRVYYNN